MSDSRITISFTDLSQEQKGSIEVKWNKENNTQTLNSKRQVLKQAMLNSFNLPRMSSCPELFKLYIQEMSELPFKIDEKTKLYYSSAGRPYIPDRELAMMEFRYLPHFKAKSYDSSLCLDISLYTCDNRKILPLVESLLKINITDFNKLTQLKLLKCSYILRDIFDSLSQPSYQNTNNILGQEYVRCANDLLNDTYKTCSASTDENNKTLHNELKKAIAYKNLYEQDQLKLAQAKNERDQLITAIQKEINRLDSTNKFFTIGKSKKSTSIIKALNNAIDNAGINDLETFLNYKLDDSLSIKEALNSPRKWPGLKPLHDQSDAWSNVEKVSITMTNVKKNIIK